MNTLTEFKKQLQRGTQVRQIWNSREGEVNYIFTVTKVQTQSVATTCPDLSDGPYWMTFPDRASIVFTENGWIRMKDGKKMAEYAWVSQQGA